MAEDWWETLFSAPLWMEVQAGMWPAEISRQQAGQIAQLLEISPPDPILDVPCGEGRLSIELADLGYRVTGVDLTGPLLDRARGQAELRGVEVSWLQGDMRHLPEGGDFAGGFEAAFGAWGSFGYFDDAGNLTYLQAVARALRPGGRFLFDGHCMESLLPQFQKRGWGQVGQVLVLEERRLDLEQGAILGEWTFIKGQERDQQKSVMRLYTYRQIVELLQAAGFERWQSYGSLNGEPFELGAKRLVMVARKPT